MKKVGTVQTTLTEAQVKSIMKDDKTSKSKKMIALFEGGFQVKEISDMMGVRYNFVYNVVSNYCTVNGIPTETEAKTGKKDTIIALYLAGKTSKEIAIETRSNSNYVYNTLKVFKQNNPNLVPRQAPDVTTTELDAAVSE